MHLGEDRSRPLYTGLSPGQKVTDYKTYTEAAAAAKTLSEEVRKQKRQTARTGETWELELATSARDKAIKYMSDHASEAAGRTSLKIEGDTARFEQRLRSWERTRQEMAQQENPDVDAIQNIDRRIATWKKALGETKKSEILSPDALFSGLSFEEAGNVTTEKYTQYTKAKQSFDKLYGNLNDPSSALGYQSAYTTLERLRQEYLAGVNYMVTHYREAEIDDSWRDPSYTTNRGVYQTEMNLLQDQLERLLDDKDPDPIILSDILTQMARKKTAIDNATKPPQNEYVFDEAFLGNYAQTRTIEGQMFSFLVGMTPLRILPDALNVMYVIDHWDSTSFKQKALTFMNALPYLGKLGQLAKGAKYADEAGQAAALLDQAEEISNALAIVTPEAGSTALATISQAAGDYGSLASQIGRGSNLVNANLADRSLDIFTQHQGAGSGRSFAPERESGIINTDRMFNSRYDPMQEAMGSAFESNPNEVEEIYQQLTDWGVVIEPSEQSMGYQPIEYGKPGVLRVPPDASYSAWLHEAQHAIDDYNAGWNGKQILYHDRTEFIRRETVAYQREIDLAESMGLDKMVKRLEVLRDETIADINRFFGLD